MNRDNKGIGIIGIVLLVLMVFCMVGYFTYPGRTVANEYEYNIKKIDENTKYSNLKKVEDTCRSMISSYESDKLTYEQYKESQLDDERSWAEQAKMRANKTASTYNNYMLNNSFQWENNIPQDINFELQTLE